MRNIAWSLAFSGLVAARQSSSVQQQTEPKSISPVNENTGQPNVLSRHIDIPVSETENEVRTSTPPFDAIPTISPHDTQEGFRWRRPGENPYIESYFETRFCGMMFSDLDETEVITPHVALRFEKNDYGLYQPVAEGFDPKEHFGMTSRYKDGKVIGISSWRETEGNQYAGWLVLTAESCE